MAARRAALLRSARIVIASLERHIPQLYTEGLYLAFAAGFYPHHSCGMTLGVPVRKTLEHQILQGGTVLVDEQGKPISPEEVVNYAVSNLPEGHYLLKEKAPQRG